MALVKPSGPQNKTKRHQCRREGFTGSCESWGRIKESNQNVFYIHMKFSKNKFKIKTFNRNILKILAAMFPFSLRRHWDILKKGKASLSIH